MEQAPPPPAPPGATFAKSPQLYMTPHLAKRKDGICPSLFEPTKSTSKAAQQQQPGSLHKPYQTNSSLLLQVNDDNGIHHEVSEIQALMDVVTDVLNQLANAEKKTIASKINFTPEGCNWKVDFHASLGETTNSYTIQIVLQANVISEMTNYVVDSILVPLKPVDPNPLATQLPGYKEAKSTFDIVSFEIRKGIVRLEFPDFPEGCRDTPFKEVYQLNARLKSGSFATVCRGTHRATGRKVAIKCVLRKDLPPADDAAIYDEVAILSSIRHPHIVPIIDFFDEKDCYFIIMELMSGGDLFDRIGKKKTYNEADARDLVVKMLKAVAVCHQRDIAHCDMKPKNLLLVADDDDSFIKLADFGFAARVHRPKSLTKQCGTPFFVAPEILTRKPYDQQSDMWSVGCIVFLLLSGNLPFLGRSQKELFRKIVSGKYEFKPEDWERVSEDAKDLVARLLVLDPDKRITAKKALLHPWLTVATDRLSKIGLQSTSQRLKTFNAKMKLRSAMIAVDMVSSLKKVSGMSSRNLSISSASSKGSNSASLPRPRRPRRKPSRSNSTDLVSI